VLFIAASVSLICLRDPHRRHGQRSSALDTLVVSFVVLTTAILYFDLLARATERPTPSRPEYEHLRDLE